MLYSHGYVNPGEPNPAMTTLFDPVVGEELLNRGYALAGSAYKTTGWAVEDAFIDQIALVDHFNKSVGQAKRVIAWGHSMGGLITAGLVQKYPDRFAGALPICGAIGGSVGLLNQLLDGGFAFKTLLAPLSPLQVARITNPGANLDAAKQVFIEALNTPQGRARLSLVAALAGTPSWKDADTAKPDAKDFETRFQNEIGWLQEFTLFFTLGFSRAEIEQRAGGNPSTNVGVDYAKQLKLSSERDLAEVLYKQAGLDLDKDLAALNTAPRIGADTKAVDYMSKNIIFNGEIKVPVLTMHTEGDGFVPVASEQSYRDAVHQAGNGKYLREIYTHRAGHCTFTPAETLTAIQTLVNRIDYGKWHDSTKANKLNQKAVALGPKFSTINDNSGNDVVIAPAFRNFKPSKYMRPFTAVKVIKSN